MAIEKHLINASLASVWSDVADILRAALVTDLGLATSVTSDSNIVVAATGLTLTFTYDPNTVTYSIEVSNGSNSQTWAAPNTNLGTLIRVTTCSNGVIMDFAGYASYYSSMIFTKTNDNKLGFIWNLPSDNIYGLSMAATAVDDVYVQSDAINFSVSMSAVQQAALVQTSLTPFLFWPGSNETRYAPNALYSLRPVDVSTKFGDYILGSYHYVSNGMVWLKDDPV